MRRFTCDRCLVEVKDYDKLETICLTHPTTRYDNCPTEECELKDLCSKCRKELQEIVKKLLEENRMKIRKAFLETQEKER